MGKTLLILVGLVFLCTPSSAQSMDKYGGLLGTTCTNTTGRFQAEKIGDRWWLCTPLGHIYFFEGIGALNIPKLSKYNNSDNTAAEALLNQIQNWNFNGIGEGSYQLAEPIATCHGCAKLPEFQLLLVSNYAAVNLWSYAQRPTKNMTFGLNEHYHGWRSSLMDYFEPEFGVWLDGFFAHDSAFAAYKASPYFVGVMLDDTDWFSGIGAGPDFHSVPQGHTNPHAGYMVLITSPLQTFNRDPGSRGVAELYADTRVYSKTAMANPPVNCSVQTPCSLRDYLFRKYDGNIAALNAAWGSNYSTFDSTGTVVTDEVIAVADGKKNVFSYALAKSPISPHSLVLRLNGIAQGGDCPECDVSSGGTIAGPSTSAIVTGVQPWLRGTQISEKDCEERDCSLPPASYWVRTAWHGCASAASRSVGSTYSEGRPQITVGTANGTTPPKCATGVDIYVSCRLLFSSVPAHGCLPRESGNPEPNEMLQASDVGLNGGSWTEPKTGLVRDVPVPAPPSFINYSSGQIQVTLSSAPRAGQRISASYVSSGWEYGTGLMDEDGRHTSWLGTNAICLNPATVCDGRDFPKPDANRNLANDLDDWIAQFTAQYFGVMNKHLKAAAPHMLYFGADTVGTWGVPPRKQILEGAAPYVDGLCTTWFGNQPDARTGDQQYEFLTRYIGDKPILNFVPLHAQPDSAMSEYGQSKCCFGSHSQAARGEQWGAVVSSMLNKSSYTGTYQWIGIVWWGLYDFDNEKIDWGLKTPDDNSYDGHEAVSARVPCSPPLEKYMCGGEKRNYGDAISYVRIANREWIEKAAKAGSQK